MLLDFFLELKILLHYFLITFFVVNNLLNEQFTVIFLCHFLNFKFLIFFH